MVSKFKARTIFKIMSKFSIKTSHNELIDETFKDTKENLQKYYTKLEKIDMNNFQDSRSQMRIY